MTSHDLTKKGEALTELFALASPFNFALASARDQLAYEIGITGARWQLLIAIVKAQKPETVSNFSRNLGLSRQSIQRLADELEAAGFIHYCENPHHKRAPNILLSENGRKAYQKMKIKHGPWVNHLADSYSLKDLNSAIDIIRSLKLKLEEEFNI